VYKGNLFMIQSFIFFILKFLEKKLLTRHDTFALLVQKLVISKSERN